MVDGDDRVLDFTFMVADTGACASFKLVATGTVDGLHRRTPKLHSDILTALIDVEDAMLLRRCVVGWGPRPLALMETPPNAIAERFTDVMGAFDPRTLQRKVPE
jgi:hypothetical protein